MFAVPLGEDLEEGEVDEEEAGQSSQPAAALAVHTAIPTLTSSTATTAPASSQSSSNQQASTSGGGGRGGGETSGTSATAKDSKAASSAGPVKRKIQPISWEGSSCEFIASYSGSNHVREGVVGNWVCTRLVSLLTII